MGYHRGRPNQLVGERMRLKGTGGTALPKNLTKRAMILMIISQYEEIGGSSSIKQRRVPIASSSFQAS